MTENGETTTYTYNGLNQLTKKTDSGGTTNYSYDLRGNQTEEKGPGLYRKYVYLVTGELAEVRNGASAMQENTYNHEGIRISREEDGDVRQYFYDQSGVAYTKDNGSISSANVRDLDGNIISATRGSSSYLYTEDIQGSTGIILDSSFQKRNTYDYTDFGEVTVSGTSQIENEICYTGAVYDETTGLHYLNARYYDPENGRFISQDSYRGELNNPMQWHLYAYCANNPVNYTDPSGHDRVKSNNKRKLFYVPIEGLGHVFSEVRTYINVYYKVNKNTKKKTITKMTFSAYGNKYANYGSGKCFFNYVKIYKGSKLWKTIKFTSNVVKNGGPVFVGSGQVCYTYKKITKDYAVGKNSIKVIATFAFIPPPESLVKYLGTIKVQVKF